MLADLRYVGGHAMALFRADNLCQPPAPGSVVLHVRAAFFTGQAACWVNVLAVGKAQARLPSPPSIWPPALHGTFPSLCQMQAAQVPPTPGPSPHWASTAALASL
ncbi:hypothetical protein PAL_GLEAN10018964 [Pteropus alecto]|uniref:Uncharacterized protein n=1 Tax=Pteropus alecto TaxID=9402 RepID=L5L333_PTEAL|nr:hypothetical protein PAL_GLEAN10018964 [Pteropus alecto]